MFQFHELDIQGLRVIEPQVFHDSRGFFFESYHQKDFFDAGITNIFIQDNHSYSHRWVLRGMHFQTQNTQAKLVRVAKGSVYDIAIDLRSNSETFWKWHGIILSAENKKQFFIPAWFAHWFLTLENDTEFLYKCDAFYDKNYDAGISPLCPHLNLDWETYVPKRDWILSEKDRKHPGFLAFSSSSPF